MNFYAFFVSLFLYVIKIWVKFAYFFFDVKTINEQTSVWRGIDNEIQIISSEIFDINNYGKRVKYVGNCVNVAIEME